jgi:hypothetical protein
VTGLAGMGEDGRDCSEVSRGVEGGGSSRIVLGELLVVGGSRL